MGEKPREGFMEREKKKKNDIIYDLFCESNNLNGYLSFFSLLKIGQHISLSLFHPLRVLSPERRKDKKQS